MCRILFLIVIHLLFLNSYSQKFKFGPQIGINLSSIGVNTPDSMPLSDMKPGYKFGLFARIYIQNLYIQPEINYSLNRASFDVFSKDLQKLELNGLNTGNIQNTILIGYRLGSLRLNIGPTLIYRYHENSDFKDNLIVNLSESNSQLVYGVQLGLGFNIARKWNFEISYTRSFNKLSYIYKIGTLESTTSGISSAIALNWGYNLVRF